MFAEMEDPGIGLVKQGAADLVDLLPSVAIAEHFLGDSERETPRLDCMVEAPEARLLRRPPFTQGGRWGSRQKSK